MANVWLVAPSNTTVEQLLARELGVHILTARLLVNRGFTDPSRARAFLEPKISDLHDPFGLPDMDKAARKIADAIAAGEKIFVHGDYDVDGVTSTALYVRSLKILGAKVIHKVPHRQKNGYDLRMGAVQLAYQEGAKLLITTDCGIQACEAVNFANSMGICVIVTDHHEPGANLPNAYAVVNPKRHDSTYAFPHLAGVGVACKTMQAVTRLLRPNLEKSFICKYLDMVALGTISDVMPLIGENRIFVKEGLQALRLTKKVGLQALLKSAGIKPLDQLSTETVGFSLGPRINAAGRVDDARHALSLLLTKSTLRAEILSNHLNACNVERQRTQKRMVAEAVLQAVSGGLTKLPVIVVSDPRWNAGVVGIVAGKLVEQFHRPAIVIGISEDGTWGKGSARSIPAFDLYKGIDSCRDLLGTYGGHAYAAGLSVSMENLTTFYNRICEHAAAVLTPDDFKPHINIDSLIDTKDLNMAILEEWDRLQPYGQGNPAPLLISKQLRVSQKRRIGKDLSHLKFSVDSENSIGTWQTGCIGWGMADEWDNQIESGDEIDLVYAPSINEYNGKRSVQFIIKDLCMAGSAPVKTKTLA